MPFDLPNLSEALYRAMRLRRLISCAILFPLLIVALLGLVGLSGVGGSLLGLFFVALIFTIFIGGHAVVFPNANEETLSISLVLTVFSLNTAIFGGSVLAWIVFIVFTVWAMMWGQNSILGLISQSGSRKMTTKARIKVDAETEAAREWFPLAPDRERAQFRCGPPDTDGIFPVHYDFNMADIFEDLNLVCTTEQSHVQEIEEVEDLRTDDPAYDVKMALRRETSDQGQPGDAPPSFWAVIEADEQDYQKTRILTKDMAGAWVTESVVEHHFKAKKNGCVVIEAETAENFPIGQAITMWLSDFQADGLAYLRDLLVQQPSLSLRQTHRWSLLLLAGKWFAQRTLREAPEA